MAGLAFIPFLGFFLGSIAVAWGLVSGRPGARRAVIIAATGALLNIVGILVITAIASRGDTPYQEGYLRGIRQDLGQVAVALEEHRARTHSYPESLAALQLARGPLHPIAILDLGPGLFHLRIPQPYHYVVAPDGSSYDLFSVGPDGTPGTDDDLRPLIPDSLRGKTGLRPAP